MAQHALVLGPSDHIKPDPIVPPNQSPALLFGQDFRTQAEQGAGFCFLQERLQQRYLPATISSWIKLTVILCYELTNQEALTLHQVKAHDVRAFAASKALQTRISLEQILEVSHLHTVLFEGPGLG